MSYSLGIICLFTPQEKCFSQYYQRTMVRSTFPEFLFPQKRPISYHREHFAFLILRENDNFLHAHCSFRNPRGIFFSFILQEMFGLNPRTHAHFHFTGKNLSPPENVLFGFPQKMFFYYSQGAGFLPMELYFFLFSRPSKANN